MPECHVFRPGHIMINVVLDHIYKLFALVIVQNRGPKVTAYGITGGDGFDLRITCVH